MLSRLINLFSRLRSIPFGLAIIIAWATAFHPVRAEDIRPDLDYFPSRLHAVIFRNWDIVPPERLAAVLGTDVATIHKAGKQLGLTVPKPLTKEEIRRNVEIVLRRNWPLLPREQIAGLLNLSPTEFDDFLSKEIFLRALLASPPAGLTLLKFSSPDAITQQRVNWFAENLKKHQKAVSNVAEEPRLFFTNELSRAHNPADHISGARPKSGDADLRSGWKMSVSTVPSDFLKESIGDFSSYCHDVHHTRKLRVVNAGTAGDKLIQLTLLPSINGGETYVLQVSNTGINIQSGTDIGIARGLVELERRMAERGGPFIARANETNRPSFNTRYVFSYYSLMTDVLGQDVVNPFPDGYLNELFHQDADGIWVYALLQDLVPSPVFEGMGQGSEARLQRLRDLVNRAAKRGLKVYVYLNEPRAQPLSFFNKYPDVKGQVEGNTAALCTSTEAVQKHLRGSFERLFRGVPGLGGVFVITASENLSNCYSHTRHPSCPRCSKRAPADVIAESIRCMAEGAWAANPQAKFIVWDWSWHSVLGEEVPEQIIQKLPHGVGLLADFERGTRIVRGGVPMNVEEYSISVVGPSPRARTRSQQAKENGFDFLAKIQLSTTWECGTIPFIAVPNLLSRKANAMREVGVSGAMVTWTIGSYPSPNTEAFAVQNWNPALGESDVLRRIAAKRYNPEAVEDAVRGWTKMSEAFTEEYPFSYAPYLGPLQHGPSLPLHRRDIPPPYGTATLFNCKDDWRSWSPPYGPDLMIKLLHHLCDRWDDGIKDLQQAVNESVGDRKHSAERDLGVSWMAGYVWRAYAHDLEFYRARDSKNISEVKRIALEEITATEEALRRVRADSRLGWEAELQYFYRPSDVLERLISLDAAVSEPPAITSN